MKTQIPKPDKNQELRDALRQICAQFDSSYWQKVDEERAYPESFVEALTKAGWLAALIPTGKGLTVRPIPNMVNHETNEVFFDNLEIPTENLIGEEGQGFRYILDGLNAERTLIAAECIGDAYWFIDRARKYAASREVFGRPIGQNQGVQFPIADSYIETEAANLMRFKACALFDAGLPCGAESNMAKYLAAKASWEAANVCLQTHGGFGFACEYDVERKFRETRLYQVAPISTNLIYSYVAEHVLDLPSSF